MLKLSNELCLKSAHDCADGGLAVTIVESCFSSLNREAIGAEIDLSGENLSAEALLFGETPSRIVVSFAADKLDKVKEIVGDCPFEVIGKVSGTNLKIKINGEEKISSAISELENSWKTSMEKQLEN